MQVEAEPPSRRLQDTAGELAGAQSQIEQFRERPARAELTERVAAESERTEHQRHRAEAAELAPS